jgi:hypothetical protein
VQGGILADVRDGSSTGSEGGPVLAQSGHSLICPGPLSAKSGSERFSRLHDSVGDWQPKYQDFPFQWKVASSLC